MKANWRRRLFNLHLCTGLVAGLFLLIASVTGCLLAYRTELDAMIHPGWFRAPVGLGRVTMDAILAAARTVHPSGALDEVSFNRGPDAPVLVQFVDRIDVWVDPHTGRLLGERNKDRSFVYIVEKLHRYLFLGKQGQWITGTASLALLIMVSTGLYLWFPRSIKAAKGSFSFNRGFRGRAWNVSLHKTVGVYAAVVLVVAAATGAADAADWVIKTYGHPEAKSANAKGAAAAPRRVAARPASFESIWRQALAVMPLYDFARITWPSKPGQPVEIQLVAANSPHDNALSSLFVDPETGAVVRYEPYEKAALVKRLYLWSLPMHLGHFWGAAGRLIVTGGSLGLSFLVATGGWLYYRRKWRRFSPAP